MDIFGTVAGYLVHLVFIFWSFGVCMLLPIGKFLVIGCIFPRFGVLYHEKSGNPAEAAVHSLYNLPQLSKLCQCLLLLN
jgi:hypothetical protein